MRLDEEIGVTYRQLDWWTRQGYLKGTSAGSGIVRNYAPSEKQVARYMGRLVRVGFSPKQAAQIARVMVEQRCLTIDLGDNIFIEVDRN